jgi:hypothetical protein
MATHNENTNMILLTESQALRAIHARIQGDFDNEDLLRIGLLMTDADADILYIIEKAIGPA